MTVGEFSSVPDKEIVGAVMQRILDNIVAVFEQAGVTLPERQFLAVGRTAHDCEQLSVSFQQMYLGMPGDRADAPQKCNSPRSVYLTVQLVRRVVLPTSRASAPNAFAMTERTLERTQDAWLLMDGALLGADDYIGVFADIAVTDPQGEYQAVVLNVTVGVP